MLGLTCDITHYLIFITYYNDTYHTRLDWLADEELAMSTEPVNYSQNELYLYMNLVHWLSVWKYKLKI